MNVELVNGDHVFMDQLNLKGPSAYGHIRVWRIESLLNIRILENNSGIEPPKAQVVAWILQGRLQPGFFEWWEKVKERT